MSWEEEEEDGWAEGSITFRRNRRLADGEEGDMRIAREQTKTRPLNGWKGLRKARGPW